MHRTVGFGVGICCVLRGTPQALDRGNYCWLLCHCPWTCPRHRTASGGQRCALQHRFRDRNRPPSRARHRDRPHPSMAGRTHSLAVCGRHCRHGWRLFPLEGDFGRSGVRMRWPRLILFWLTLAITLTVAPAAQAHLMNTGFGPFYDGLTHLFVTPEDLLPVIALALLAGLRGPRFGRAVLFALPVAWLVGSAAGLLLAPQVTLPVAETIVTIALGALLAADCPLPLAAVGGLAILLGLLHGSLNGSEFAKTNASGQVSAAGVAAALFAVVSLLAGQAASVRVPWARVAVRVAGSWIVAIGLLMLGWAMRAPG